MSEGYSLDKWRNAPETTHNPEEQKFLADFEELATKYSLKPGQGTLRLLSFVLYPDAWVAAFMADRARELRVREETDSKPGQIELARKEAEEINEEYERLRTEAEEAVREFEEFIEEASGRISSEQ